ncbi:MAG: hypothetical protein GF398_18730 [Chitinivibrionales bacterium]|nr:hypothetical protein [Chitinivibrionales bacterium]
MIEHDSKERRCPLLGHAIRFSYCRQPGASRPCPRILDCWWETFDIVTYAKASWDNETLAALQQPPPPKTASLLSLIEEAEKRIRNAP